MIMIHSHLLLVDSKPHMQETSKHKQYFEQRSSSRSRTRNNENHSRRGRSGTQRSRHGSRISDLPPGGYYDSPIQDNALIPATDPLPDPQSIITVLQVVVVAVHYQVIMSILIIVDMAHLLTQTIVPQA